MLRCVLACCGAAAVGEAGLAQTSLASLRPSEQLARAVSAAALDMPTLPAASHLLDMVLSPDAVEDRRRFLQASAARPAADAAKSASLFSTGFGYATEHNGFERLLHARTGAHALAVGDDLAWALRRAKGPTTAGESALKDDEPFRLLETGTGAAAALLWEQDAAYAVGPDFRDWFSSVALVPAPHAALLGVAGLSLLSAGWARRRR